jgi:hypothetical protein
MMFVFVLAAIETLEVYSLFCLSEFTKENELIDIGDVGVGRGGGVYANVDIFFPSSASRGSGGGTR